MVIGVVVAFFMAVAFMWGGPVVGSGVVFHFYDSATDTGEEQESKIQEDSLP